jgi:hypothetical protein
MADGLSNVDIFCAATGWMHTNHMIKMRAKIKESIEVPGLCF